ncbi:MAG: hypothetical protein ILA06_04925 [Bacteroidaceae bacterium]|nr:hypothetical protein [Bacteroidaceae bacterium]
MESSEVKKVYVNPLKVSLFEVKFGRNATNIDELSVWLNRLLYDTMGKEVELLNGLIYTNPTDATKCAEQIRNEIEHRMREGHFKKANSAQIETFKEYLREWVADVKAKGRGSINNVPQNYDFDGIVEMFKDRKKGEKFVKILWGELEKQGRSINNVRVVASLAARRHNDNTYGVLNGEWHSWSAFWGNIKKCLGLPQDKYKYGKGDLLKWLGKA